MSDTNRVKSLSRDLTVLVPSMGRPKNAVRLYESFRETCRADTELLIVCSNNDSQLPKYLKLLNGYGRVLQVAQGRRGMVDALNTAFSILYRELGFAVAFLGDDHRPRTVGWDEMYLETLRGLGTGMVYGDDLLQGENIPTQIAMTTDIPKALGYMVPPEFQHLWVDVVWKDWGNDTGRIVYRGDVVVEHLHPLAGKAQSDANYDAVNSSAVATHDQLAYAAYHDSGRFAADCGRLRALL